MKELPQIRTSNEFTIWKDTYVAALQSQLALDKSADVADFCARLSADAALDAYCERSQSETKFDDIKKYFEVKDLLGR